MVVCVPAGNKDYFTDSPSVIFEVLSATTRRNDQAQKFRDYITIPTLQTYVMAESDSALLTVFRRAGSDFRREVIAGIDAVLELPEVGVAIPLAEL